MQNHDVEHPRETASKAFFDEWAKTYDRKRITPWFHYTQELAIGALTLGPESRLLDIGCGTGYATIHLASLLPRGRACGVDISEGMIARARMNIPEELKDRVEFHQSSASDLKLADESFTHIICTNSFHHYPDPLQALGEMKRVLVPGGQIAILDNAIDRSFYTWLWDRFLHIVEKGHVRYYRSNEIGEMIRQAGFVNDRLLLRNEFLKHGKLAASLQLWTAVKPAAAHPQTRPVNGPACDP